MTTSELRKSLRLARLRLREAEDALLAERSRESELRRAYGEAREVPDSVLPRHLRERN